MNEVEYILRIVLKARDELAGALAAARAELRGFARDAENNKKKIDGFNDSIEKMNTNVANITDKFREWRTVIQGVGDGNADAKKSFGDLGKEVDNASKASKRHADEQTKAARAQDALTKSADKLRNEYRKLQQQEQANDKDRAFAIFRLKEIGRQLESISKKVDDPDIRKFYFNWAQDSKRAADSIIQDIERVDKAAAAEVRNEEQRVAKRQSIRERDAAARAAFTRAREVSERIKGDDPSAIDVAEAKQTVTVLRQVARQYDDTTKTARNLRGEAERLSGSMRRTSRDADRSGNIFGRIAHYFDRNKESVAGLDNTLRGMGWLLAAGFAQQLITVLGGLAGSFVAVASSAAQAGAAIGGAFVAGVGQALPSIALLGAAMVRVSSVMDAVKQQQLMQKQEFTQGAAAGRRVADATDTIANAQDSLANANRSVSDAQKGLTEARKDAREELDDLAAAEKRADLAARGAVLSQKEAQEALRLAMSTGDVEGIARAELAVLEAQADAEDKLKDARKARIDAAKGERGGVEGTEGVQDAKRTLEDAERAATKAARGIATAQRNAAEAAAGTNTAAAALQFFLSQLSPAEQRLYQAVTNFQKLFSEGPWRDITDNIINSFARSVEGVTKIIQMPAVLTEARRTSVQLGRQMNRMFDAFTGDDMIKQFLRIAEAGRKNLAPLTDIGIAVGKSLANIAETAGPALSRMLRFIRGLVQEFQELTGQRSKMRDFFLEGEKHFEAWIKLGLSVIQLFMALAGAGGAESGLKSITDATKAIDGLTEKVNDNKGAVADFFEDARKITYQVVEVVAALAKELERSFTPERVQKFTDLLKEVLIPALGDAIYYMGEISNFLLNIAESPAGREILKLGIALFFVSKILLSSLGVLKGFIESMKFFLEPLVKLMKYLPGMSRLVALFNQLGAVRFVAMGGGIGLVVGLIVLLLAKLGLLDEVWAEITDAFKALWGQVQPPLERFVESFEGLWAAISEGEGAFAALEPVLRVLIKVGGFLLEGVFKAIGQVIGGLIDIIGGLIDVVVGLLSGDFGKALEGVKDIFRGLANIIIGGLQLLLFRGLGGLLRSAGGLVVRGLSFIGRGIVNFLKSLPRRFSSAADDIAAAFGKGIGKLGTFIRDAAVSGWNFIRRFPGRFWELAKDIVSRFWRGYQRLGRIMREGISDAWNWIRRLPGRFWELAKDIVSFFWRGYRALGRRLRSAIEDAWDWIKGFPKRFENLAKDAVNLFVKAFKGLGKSIIDVVSAGVGSAGNFAKKLINGIFKLIEDGWNKGIGGKKVLGVSLPDIKIPRLAAGGPIPGSGKGDRYPALLEAGEHVWTADEVRRAGGHEAMFLMRAFFGGGGQGRGGRYADGGKPEAAGAGALTISFEGGNLDDFASKWRTFWTVLALTARRGADVIEKQFRDMRVKTTTSADRMYREVRSSLEDIQTSFRVRGRRIVTTWADMWMSLKKVSYDGLNYIAHETNKALKGMGEKIVHFGLSEPKKADAGKAVGGWIGGKGQRGKDRGFYALGAGEAVLNWQHQKYVEPALNAFYGHGLTELFGRTRGYHAGGAEQPGFAAGKLPDVLGSKPGFGVFMQLFRQLAGKDVYVMSGSRPGSITTSGNTSNHSLGNAIDISNIISQGGSPGNPPPKNPLDSLHKWIDSHIPKPPRLDFLWRTTVGGNHYNHIHLGLNEAVTKTIAAARNYIKNNLGEEFGSLVGALDPIKKRFVTPKGLMLSNLVQKSLDKVLKAANKMIEETFPDTGDAGGQTGDYEGGVLSQGEVQSTIRKALDILGIKSNVAMWVKAATRQAYNESTFNPGARNDTPAGQAAGGPKGLMQVVDGTFAAYKYKSYGDVFNPLDNMLAAIRYVIARYGSGNADAGANALWAHGGGAYARGGEIPGGEGMPVPILAHAREWILNSKQQARLTQMLGMPRNMLKNWLGFPSRSGQAFQVGGEVEAGAEDEKKLNIGVTTKSMRERIARIRKGLYALPALPIQSWETALREANRAFLAIKRRGKALSIEVGELNEQIKELEKGDETKAEKAKIKKLKAERKALIEGGTMVKEIAKVNKEIEQLQKGDEDKKQLREIAKLRAERRKLQSRGRAEVALQARLQALQALVREGGIIEQMDAARERFTSRLARGLTFATYSFNKANRRVTKQLTEVQAASRELENARDEMTKILGEEGVITKALKRVNQRVKNLKKGGITEEEAPELRELVTMQVRLREQRVNIRDLHAQQLQRIYEAQVARQQAIVDEINSRAERDIGVQDIQRRMGEAVGNEGMIDAANQAARAIQTRQMGELQARVAAAARIGNTEMVNSLTAQIADLRTTIYESIQQELRDAAERINARAQRRLGRLDLGGRMLDAVGAVGLGSVAAVAGEQFSRGGLYAQRQGVLEGQRGELQGLLGRAGAAGNIALVQDLTDQLAELDVTIQENTKGYFDARVEDVNRVASFGLNVNDLMKQIAELEGTAAGQVDQARISNLLIGRGNILNEQRVALEALLLEAQRTGNQQAVNDLTVALLENKVATLQNTAAVEEANGLNKDPQTFTSSAWTRFREAIFSGMGQVLPQYDPNNLGMAGMNTGAVIYPSVTTSSRTSGDTNIILNESGRPPDLTEISSVVTFASKTAQ